MDFLVAFFFAIQLLSRAHIHAVTQTYNLHLILIEIFFALTKEMWILGVFFILCFIVAVGVVGRFSARWDFFRCHGTHTHTHFLVLSHSKHLNKTSYVACIFALSQSFTNKALELILWKKKKRIKTHSDFKQKQCIRNVYSNTKWGKTTTYSKKMTHFISLWIPAISLAVL